MSLTAAVGRRRGESKVADLHRQILSLGCSMSLRSMIVVDNGERTIERTTERRDQAQESDLIEEDVARLQIAMYDVLRVYVRQSRHHLSYEFERIRGQELLQQNDLTARIQSFSPIAYLPQ
jgi:hypothetical protein